VLLISTHNLRQPCRCPVDTINTDGAWSVEELAQKAAKWGRRHNGHRRTEPEVARMASNPA